MKKDITVDLAVLFLPIILVVLVKGSQPSTINSFSSLETYSQFAAAFSAVAHTAILRLFILTIQTLLHAAKHSPAEDKTRLILCHLLLGPVIAVPYFYLSRTSHRI